MKTTDHDELQNGDAFEALREQIMREPATRERLIKVEAELRDDRRALWAGLAPNVRIGLMLRAARAVRGKTQREHAQNTGVLQSEISRVENGGGSLGPSMETIVNYAHDMDYEVVVLLKPREQALSKELKASFEVLDGLVEDPQSSSLWDVF
jgi:transcriptional regulator with XRE-family HTH domain